MAVSIPLDELNVPTFDEISLNASPVPAHESKKGAKNGVKGEGFDLNTFNPMLYLTQFGIESIQTNMQDIDSASKRMEYQENILNTTNNLLDTLVNKTMASQKTLNSWGQILTGGGLLVGGALILFGALTAPLGGFLLMGAGAAILTPLLVEGKGNPFSTNKKPDSMISDVPNAGNLLKDQTQQNAINTVATQSSNSLSAVEKIGVENASDKDLQMSQMIDQALQALAVVMSTKV